MSYPPTTCGSATFDGKVCGHEAGKGHDSLCMYGHPENGPVHQLRSLLLEWEKYARTMVDAGIIAGPVRLLERTVGVLDATAV